MIDADVFNKQMKLTAKMFGREVDEDITVAYLEAFAQWPSNDFIGAMKWCREHMTRFPKPAEITQARPKHHKVYRAGIEGPAEFFTGSDQEMLDSMTEEQIDEALGNDFMRKMYRRDPKSIFARDTIKEWINSKGTE